LKSGTDFRQFSVVTLHFDDEKRKSSEAGEAGETETESKTSTETDKTTKRNVRAEIEAVEVTKEKFPVKDIDLEKELEKFTGKKSPRLFFS